MSGGHFNYTDQISDYSISEELQCDIETLSAKIFPLSKEEQIQIDSANELKAVCRIVFDWLHDYDHAASDDTRFEYLPSSTDEHKRKLREVLGNEN